MTPQGETSNAGSRQEHDAGQSLSSEVAERSRRCERELTALVQDVDTILRRREERARDVADRLLDEARIEAARLISEARREVVTLTEQMDALKRAQHDASVALEQTRDALTAALGSVDVGRSPLPRATPPRAPVPAPVTHGRHTALSLDRAVSPAKQAQTARLITERIKSRLGANYRRLLIFGTAAAVLVAAAAAVWTVVRSQPETAEHTAHTDAASRERRAPAAAPAALTGSRPDRGSVPSSRTASAPMVVTLEAVRPVWVRAIVDGRTEKGSELAAGTRRRVTASSEIVIRAGDAGALLVAVDGGQKSRFGRDGQVRTRRFATSESTTAPARRADAEPPRQPDQAVAEPIGAPAVAAPLPAAPLPLVEIPVTSGGGALEGTPVATSDALAAPPRPIGAAGTPSTAVDEILELDRQWFEAYYRNERGRLASLSAPGFEMADSRSAVQDVRPASPPNRGIRDVRVDVHADGAVLSGRMIERLSRNGEIREEESFVSEVWVRLDGTWRLLSLRLASVDQVRQTSAPLVK